MTQRGRGATVEGGRRKPYATGLDGVRALAVAVVVLYHAGVPGFRGGFIGVDLFFVVSGYLVTALLQREHDRSGRIAVRAFFVRRARRLLPALALMLLVVSAATLALGRDLGAGLRMQLGGAVTFSSNLIQIASGSSYVNRSEPSVFTHLWSLAVEEQYYLLWPMVCVLLLVRLGRRRQRVAVVVGAALASALAMALLFRVGADPTRVYVGTDTHGFGLLLGSALALSRPLSMVDPPLRRRGRIQRATLVIGPLSLLVVLCGVLFLTDTGPVTYRGGLLLVDVAAVAMVAAAIRSVGPLPRLFARPGFRWLGLRSYSLYLWHWPALVIADRVLSPEWGRTFPAVLAVASALVAAEVSWRFVEDPIRRLGPAGYIAAIRRVLAGRSVVIRRRSVGWTAAGALVLVTGIAACGVVVAPAQGEVAVSLAAGEQALEQASAQGGPTPVLSTSVSPTSVLSTSVLSTSVLSTSVLSTSKAATSVGSAAVTRPHRPATSAPSTSGPSRPSGVAHAAARSAPARTATPPSTSPPGAVPSPRRPTAPPVVGANITAVGDSVMLASAPAFLARFPGSDIDAVVSRQIWDLGALLGPKRPTLRPYLVIGLGTNGTDSVAHIASALAQLPASEVVVLINSYVPQSWQDATNAALLGVAASRPHTCVADWHAAIAAHLDLLGPDGVHPRAAGGRLYVDTVAAALQRCR